MAYSADINTGLILDSMANSADIDTGLILDIVHVQVYLVDADYTVEVGVSPDTSLWVLKHLMEQTSGQVLDTWDGLPWDLGYTPTLGETRAAMSF